MKYSEFICSNNNFQSSVNLQYDLNREQKISSYIPTQQSITILKRYLNSAYNDSYNEDNATVLIGPYGRGKSHLLLILASLISCGMGIVSDNIIDELNHKLALSDESVGELAALIKKKNKPFLPVIINSNHTDVNQSFIIALREALDRNNLNDFFPETYFESAIKMIEKWENEFENAIKIFKRELKKEKIELSSLKDSLHKCSPAAYQIFCDIYPLVSNGASFNPMQNTDVVKMYEKVSDALIEQKGFSGIYIIFDEFSKFLESSTAMKDMQNLKLIQDFAELAVRGNKLHICCITHKDILDYSQSDSFRTVDGRFKKVYFVASSEQSYELVANAICHKDGFDDFYNKHSEDFDSFNQLCHLTGLFNDLSSETYNNTLVKNCFPLHPISVYALIRISEAVGQNERTLFTFLSQEGDYSFNDFLNKTFKKTEFPLLTIDRIFDYFSDLFRVEVFNTKIHSIWSKTKSAIAKCENDEQIKIVKILAICKMINNDTFVASDINLKASANMSDSVYRSTMNSLSSLHILTQRRDGVYEFLTPNGVDIKRSIQNLIQQGSIKLDRPGVLKDAFSTPFILPRQHNGKMRIMRYFSTTFMEASDFWNYTGDFKEIKKNADGLIIYLISNDYTETAMINERLEKLHADSNILVCVSNNWEHDDVILEYQAACVLETQSANLDEHFKEELQVYKYDLFKSIKEMADSLYSPVNPNVAYYNAQHCFEDITKPLLLNRELSIICDNVYSKTPIINNEMVNKNKLTAQIKKARVKVIDWLLEYTDDIPRIEGYGPEVSLLCSTIMVKGLDKSEISSDTNLNDALSLINNLIDESEKEAISFDKLYDALQLPPFGLRKGIIPIYIAFAMRKKQGVIVLSYRSREILLDADMLSQIEEAPAEYSFYTEKGTKEKDEYVDAIISMFAPENYQLSGNKCAFALDAMQKWFRGLSKFARDHAKIYTESGIKDLEKRLLSFKRQLLQYDVNPHSFLFADIPEFFDCEDDFVAITEKLKEFEVMHSNFISDIKKYLVDRVSGLFNASINGSLCSVMKDWYDSLPDENKNHVFSSNVNAFIHFVRENDSYDDVEVISKLAKSITFLAIEDWNDNSVPAFISDIENYIDTVNKYQREETALSDDGHIGLSIDFAGKIYEKNITDTEISGIAETALNNIETELDDYGDAITAQERIALLLRLLRKEIDKL